MISLAESHLMLNLSNMKRAEISIYLTLILGVMLSLILVLVEGTRRNAIRMQIECVVDMGLHSVFAEYNRELFQQYDLLFIDTSYCTNFVSLANTEKHMLDFMDYNFNPAKRLVTVHVRDWLSISTESLAISEFSVATDEKAGVIKRQILNYMKDKFFIDEYNKFTSEKAKVENNQLQNTNINSEKARMKNEVNDRIEEASQERKEDISVDLPSENMNQVNGMSLLPYIIENDQKISRKIVNLAEYVMSRGRMEGTGIPETHREKTSALDEYLIGEYLIEKCGNYEKNKENSYLKYQIEYILSGKDNDYENLSKIANRLLLLREASNMLYLWTDNEKKAEAETAALLISTIAMIPEAEPAIKQFILLTWATAESLSDLKMLFRGEKVPILKSYDSWNLSFFEFCTFSGNAGNHQNNLSGQSYTDYLRILLNFQNSEERLMRFLNIVEMDIRKTKYNENFKIDGCIDSMTVEALFYSNYGYRYGIKRFYSYE